MNTESEKVRMPGFVLSYYFMLLKNACMYVVLVVGFVLRYCLQKLATHVVHDPIAQSFTDIRMCVTFLFLLNSSSSHLSQLRSWSEIEV